jgi:CheY-like chemotaxis protein
VSITCHAVGDQLRIDISDTGPGIPSQALDNIFEEYFQLDNPARDRSKGLGLGLAIVKYIARLLGHELAVESELGRGSTFSVFVPRVTAIPRKSIESNFIATPSPVLPKTILIVDDDDAVIDATGMWLSVEGYEIYTAMNSDQACERIANGLRPDILVTDFRLPGRTGLELIRRVRRMIDETIPAILITGDTSSPEIFDKTLRNCAVMHKPIDAERLNGLIRTLCAGKRDQPNPD